MGELIEKIKSKKAEGFVDSGIKILIAVVIGALLLAGLITIIKGNILPTVKNRIIDISNADNENILPDDKFNRKITLVSFTTPNTRFAKGEDFEFNIVLKNNSTQEITLNDKICFELYMFDSLVYFFHKQNTSDFSLLSNEEKTFTIKGKIPENSRISNGNIKFYTCLKGKNTAQTKLLYLVNGIDWQPVAGIPPIE